MHQPPVDDSPATYSVAPAPTTPVPVRNVSFQEALPLLARLGQDPAFVDAIKRIKQDQDNLERQLWADREAIQKKYLDKVKMLQDAYQKEIRKFDKERVLPAWDGLMARQQGRLGSLGVPNMFVTSDPQHTEVRDRSAYPNAVSLTVCPFTLGQLVISVRNKSSTSCLASLGMRNSSVTESLRHDLQRLLRSRSCMGIGYTLVARTMISPGREFSHSPPANRTP
ncbi:hypothetical protein NMY22_g6503 [Coprinellus aureogranulatus]|nr:hypothetical protein NMY22_g6503 [Coprinellus aureogranulatus]